MRSQRKTGIPTQGGKAFGLNKPLEHFFPKSFWRGSRGLGTNSFLGFAALAFRIFSLSAGSIGTAEVIPPAPDHYVNDYAHVLSSATTDRFNSELEDFEKLTSSQVL